jgi:hypothetical protein
VVQNATLFERDTEHGFAFPVLFQSSGKVWLSTGQAINIPTSKPSMQYALLWEISHLLA